MAANHVCPESQAWKDSYGNNAGRDDRNDKRNDGDACSSSSWCSRNAGLFACGQQVKYGARRLATEIGDVAVGKVWIIFVWSTSPAPFLLLKTSSLRSWCWVAIYSVLSMLCQISRTFTWWKGWAAGGSSTFCKGMGFIPVPPIWRNDSQDWVLILYRFRRFCIMRYTG